MKDYFLYQQFHVIRDDEWEKLYTGMPASLQYEIIKETHKTVVQTFKVFQNKERAFIMDLLPSLTQHVFFQDDILYSQSDIAEYMYFLYEGEVQLFSDISQEIDMSGLLDYQDKCVFNIQFTHYTSGGYFGDEDSLIQTYGHRNHTAVCYKQSWLYLIFASTLKSILQKYPEYYGLFTSIAR